ncbi:MAG: LytTR family DNA-binding domain-containing protein [Bacteroidota bacterium]
MTALKVVIVDDEKASTERLINLLGAHKVAISIVGVFETLETALDGIKQKSPEAVFLDVHLHDKTGFDLLSELDAIDFEVIFTTAHDRYAVEAFKFSAIDYLLKPVDPEELTVSIKRLQERTQSKNLTARVETLFHNLSEKENKTIAVPTQEGLVFLSVNKIIRCHSDANYTRIHLKEGPPLVVAKTLKQFVKLLENRGFFRVHHSSLINLSLIRKYLKGKGGVVVMADNSEIEVSIRRKEAFLKELAKSQTLL